MDNKINNIYYTKIQTDEFLNLTYSDLIDLLSRDQLNVESEETVSFFSVFN